jgi:hypothetical protein
MHSSSTDVRSASDHLLASYSARQIRMSSIGSAASPMWAAALDQRYSAAAVTRPARTGFRSTYAIACQQCAQSIGQEK